MLISDFSIVCYMKAKLQKTFEKIETKFSGYP